MSQPVLALVWGVYPFLSFAEIYTSCLLFAWHQPRRERFGRRMVCVYGLFALVSAGLAAVFMATASPADIERLPGTAPTPATSLALGVEAAGYGLFLLAMLPALLFCFDMGGWSAFFCATAGYALQNFGSSVAELLILVARAAGRPLPARSVGLLALLTCTLAGLALYRTLIAKVIRADYDALTNRSLLPMLTVVLFAVIGFDVILKSEAFAAVSDATIIATRILHIIFCLFTLFVELDVVVRRQLSIEVATAERLMVEHEHQLQLSQETIDAINLKCHDLRHQIRHLADGGTTVDSAVLADVAREVSVYDSAVRTGNQALDTILTEKRLLAEQTQAALTCVADGTALSFMAPADLYAFFGNALDNALEAVAALDDPARRSISLVARERAGMVQIHVENTCVGTVLLVDGLPQTSKRTADGAPDTANHGYGTRSMRAIVERYGGTLTYTPGPQTFALDAMMPAAQPRG